MISLRLPSADEAADPGQAARWRDLAHDLGDALDALPQPIPFKE